MYAISLAKGFWILWVILALTTALTILVRRIFRVDFDDYFNAFLITSLLVGGLIQLGWSAFVALVTQSHVVGASKSIVIILYAVGLFSCHVAYVVVSAYFSGSFYRYVNLPLAFVSYMFFSFWPAAGRALYGWFFDLF